MYVSPILFNTSLHAIEKLLGTNIVQRNKGTMQTVQKREEEINDERELIG